MNNVCVHVLILSMLKLILLHGVSIKWATFIFTTTSTNVDQFSSFFTAKFIKKLQ